MADRIPPIQIRIQAKFDQNGVRAAKKAINNFAATTEKDVDRSEKKVEELKKAWDTYSSSLDKNNKKVKKSMDAVSASFERVEKARERLLNAESQKTKALLSLENKRTALQKKKEKAATFKGESTEKYAQEQAIKEIENLQNAKLEAIKKAAEEEASFRAKLETAKFNERKANLEQERSALRLETASEEKIALEEQQRAMLNRFRRHGISIKRGSDGTVEKLYDRKTGKAKGGKESLEKIRDVESRLAIATQKANIAFDDQELKLGKLLSLRATLASAQAAYDNAVNASAGLSAEITDDEKNEISQNAKNAALKETERLANDVKVAENNLASAEETVAQATRNVEAAKRGFNIESAKTVGIVQEETAKISKLTGVMSQVKNAANKVGSGIKKLHQKIKGINFTGIIAKFYSITRITSFLNSFVEASSDWIENLNLLEVVYNDTATAADEVKNTITELSETFRMDINALAKYVSVFKQMANAMGQTAEVGSQMAEVLSLIALDVSSLRNVDVQTVVSDFTGALAGQVKPVRKYGFDITMYSIDELMKELGYGAISRSMTQANKQLARAVLLVRQSKDAWGDLAKTINTYANQQRVLNDQFTQFKRLLGNVVMGTFQAGDSFEEASKTAGIMQKGIWYLNGAMIAVNTILDAIVPKVNSFNGAIATGSEEVTSALEEEEEAVNSTLASFDKFNSLEDGSGGITGSVSEDLERLLGQETQSYMEQFQDRLKNINMYAEDIAETILGILFPEYTAWKGDDENKTFAQWAEQSGVLNEKVKEIKESILTIGRLFAWLINPALGFVTTVTTQMLEATGEERTRMLQDMVETAQGLYAALDTIAPALLKIIDAFLPVIDMLATFVSLVASSPEAIWSMVSAIIALAIAFQAAKIALSATTTASAKEIAKTVFLGTTVIGLLGTVNAVTLGLSAKAHAMGGFQTGGLFYAGEAGPEWVGRQGSTSTIINDGQMSDIMRDSVAKGVMQANIASRQISGAGRSGKVAVVNLNGKHLFDVVEQEGYKEGKVFAKSR